MHSPRTRAASQPRTSFGHRLWTIYKRPGVDPAASQGDLDEAHLPELDIGDPHPGLEIVRQLWFAFGRPPPPTRQCEVQAVETDRA